MCSLFGEDAEKKCAELNKIKITTDDGSHEDLKISIFMKQQEN